MISSADAPKLNLIGESDVKIWGLPIAEWQARAFKKAGVVQTNQASSTVHIAVEWVLSSALAKAFVSGGKMALISGEGIIGVNGVDNEMAH